MPRQFLQEIPALLRPLGALAASLVLSYLVIQFANTSVSRARQARDTQERALSEARERVRKSGEERDVIQRYLPAYYQLEKEGLVGAERRLDWVEALRVANDHAGLYGIQYEISPQQEVSDKKALGISHIDVRHSLMKLNFGLLHEGDLRRFLDALAVQGLGSFVVNQCTLTQMRRPERPVNEPNLQAQCELSWMTMSVPARKEGQ